MLEFNACLPAIQSAIMIGGGKGDVIKIKIECYQLTPEQIDQLLRFIGKEFVVSIKNKDESFYEDLISDKQNSYIHVLFQIIAKYNDCNIETVKDSYKSNKEINHISKLSKDNAKIVIEDLLNVIDNFEGINKYRELNSICELCKDNNIQIHHIRSRGAGGIDQFWNLMSLCVEHHSEFHNIGILSFAKKYKQNKIVYQKFKRYFDRIGKLDQLKELENYNSL